MIRWATIALITVLTGCATRFAAETYTSSEPGEPVKRTVINQTMAYGIPALFSSSVTVTDGDFSIATTAIDLPDLDFGTIGDD